MPGSMASTARWPWTVGHGYWRYRCAACGILGHWTTADHAHDDGRDHARLCSAYKYEWLIEQIRENNLLPIGVDCD
jgi:hypothetical protein